MTVVQFTPSPQGPFTFDPTLDGQQYSATVAWNLFGRRYYVNLYTVGGALVFCLPLIESPAGVNLQSLAWTLGKVSAVTAAPHGFTVGATMDVTIKGCVPAAYDGIVSAFITGPDTFDYELQVFPGIATQMGAASYDISMTAGYFTSTMVFRNRLFEVSP